MWPDGQSGFTDWLISVFIALILNIILFGIMPALIRMTPQDRNINDKLKFVHVTMVRPHKLPLNRKKLEQHISENNKNAIKFKNFLKPFKHRSFKIKPDLSFNSKFTLNSEFNIGAPGPESLPVMNFAMSGPALKGRYQVGELDTPLIPIVKIPPIYPAMAMRNNIQGWVKVRFLVTDKGQVKNIHVVKAVPKDIFNNSVIRCISRWKFKPGTIGGVPVNTMAETIIRFKLEQ